MRVSKSEFARIKALARKAKRAARVADNASLESVLAQTDAGRALAEAVGLPMPPRKTQDAPGQAGESNRRPIRPKRATGKPRPAKATKARKPKSSRKRLIAKLDALFSMFVRLRGKKRTGGVCELCAKRPIEVCFHWVSRGDYATRWDPDNAVASCRGCNFEETFRKRKYRDMHIMMIGEAAREALEAKSRSMTHFTDSDLEAKAVEIKTLIERLSVGPN